MNARPRIYGSPPTPSVFSKRRRPSLASQLSAERATKDDEKTK